MILAAILIFGILTLWSPARWTLSAFQVAVFALTTVQIFRRRLNWHPVRFLLVCAVLWGVSQIAAHRTIDEWKTWDAVLNWTTNLAAFSLALELDTVQREKFLRVLLIFAVLLS